MNGTVSDLVNPTTPIRSMKIIFDRKIEVTSRDVLELDMVEYRAYIKRQGMNTKDIARFRVIEDVRAHTKAD